MPSRQKYFRKLSHLWHTVQMAQLTWPLSDIFTRAVVCLTSLIIAVGFYSASATEQETLLLEANDRKWPITTIEINGQTTPALLDTGATIAMINHDVLPFEPASAEHSQTRVLGIGGHRTFPVTNIHSLSAGAQSWYNLRVAVNTETTFPVQQNILPTSIFRSRIVDFDFPNSRLQLYSGYPKFVRDAHRSAISYISHEGLIFIPVRINGVRGKALIDTGASVSFVNPRFAERARAVRRIDDEQDMQGSDLVRTRVDIYNFRRLHFGDNHISKFSVPVLETEMFRDLGFGDEPMMVMGMDLLEHFRVQIDQERERLFLLR